MGTRIIVKPADVASMPMEVDRQSLKIYFINRTKAVSASQWAFFPDTCKEILGHEVETKTKVNKLSRPIKFGPTAEPMTYRVTWIFSTNADKKCLPDDFEMNLKHRLATMKETGHRPNLAPKSISELPMSITKHNELKIQFHTMPQAKHAASNFTKYHIAFNKTLQDNSLEWVQRRQNKNVYFKAKNKGVDVELNQNDITSFRKNLLRVFQEGRAISTGEPKNKPTLTNAPAHSIYLKIKSDDKSTIRTLSDAQRLIIDGVIINMLTSLGFDENMIDIQKHIEKYTAKISVWIGKERYTFDDAFLAKLNAMVVEKNLPWEISLAPENKVAQHPMIVPELESVRESAPLYEDRETYAQWLVELSGSSSSASKNSIKHNDVFEEDKSRSDIQSEPSPEAGNLDLKQPVSTNYFKLKLRNQPKLQDCLKPQPQPQELPPIRSLEWFKTIT